MKNANFFLHLIPIIFTFAFFTACNGQEKARENVQVLETPPLILEKPESVQIADYIRHIFQDKNGNFWYGTNGYGTVHFDGTSLSYFSNEQGFDGQQITGITADRDGNIWFATDRGIVKYDWTSNKQGEKQFTNYSDKQYFGGQRFWSIYADSKNNIWAGSARGIFRFDGEWKPFELPYPAELTGEFLTEGTSCSIIEDRAGNMWFGTRGYGAYKYDGKGFTRYTAEDGLPDNEVYDIFEDSKGNIWFGTMWGGLSFFDGERFLNYNQQNSNIGSDEVCVIYEDNAGNIWFSSEGFGIYHFDSNPSDMVDQNQSFSNHSKKQGLGVGAVQAMLQDNEGRFWVGGGGGLYRLVGESFINVTKNGPWE